MLVMNNVQDIPENLIWLVNNEPVFKRQSGIYIFRFNKCEVGYTNDAINFLNCYTTLDFQRARELMLENPAMELEPMTDWNGNKLADHPDNDEYNALLKLSRKLNLGTSLTINIAPGVCSIHDNYGDEFRFPIERAQEVIEAWAIVEAARVL